MVITGLFERGQALVNQLAFHSCIRISRWRLRSTGKHLSPEHLLLREKRKQEQKKNFARERVEACKKTKVARGKASAVLSFTQVRFGRPMQEGNKWQRVAGLAQGKIKSI